MSSRRASPRAFTAVDRADEAARVKVQVNGATVSPADVMIVVAPLKPIPNLPAGYFESSRWVDGTGATVIRCERRVLAGWPS